MWTLFRAWMRGMGARMAEPRPETKNALATVGIAASSLTLCADWRWDWSDADEDIPILTINLSEK